MKKPIITLLTFAFIFLAACSQTAETNNKTTEQTIIETTTEKTTRPRPTLPPRPDNRPLPERRPHQYGGWYWVTFEGERFEMFRYLFYTLPGPFVRLVDENDFIAWLVSRSDKEHHTVNIALAFVQDFDISREDFEKANEELRLGWAEIGQSPERGANFELYPVDLIFTFDNEAINEFFLWENSPYPEWVGPLPPRGEEWIVPS